MRFFKTAFLMILILANCSCSNQELKKSRPLYMSYIDKLLMEPKIKKMINEEELSEERKVNYLLDIIRPKIKKMNVIKLIHTIKVHDGHLSSLEHNLYSDSNVLILQELQSRDYRDLSLLPNWFDHDAKIIKGISAPATVSSRLGAELERIYIKSQEVLDNKK